MPHLARQCAAKKAIAISDNGAYFDPRELGFENVGRDGAIAYRKLMEHLALSAIAARRNAGFNQLTIPLIGDLDELVQHNPCALRVSHDQLKSGNISFSTVQGCATVYLIAPSYPTYSDRTKCQQLIENAAQLQSNVVLILPSASDGVVDYFQSQFPDTPILSWPA